MEKTSFKEYVKTHKAELISAGLIIAGTALLTASLISVLRHDHFLSMRVHRMLEVAEDLGVIDKLNAHEILMMSEGR